MKLSLIFSSIVVLLTSVHADLSVSYDTRYDDANQSLSTVACSDGSNGLLTRGFTTFGSLPNFPKIGGGPAVMNYNSPNCGSCWQLTYLGPQGVKKSINILLIDVASNYNIALEAMNELTDNQAESLGRVSVTAVQLSPSDCGL